MSHESIDVQYCAKGRLYEGHTHSSQRTGRRRPKQLASKSERALTSDLSGLLTPSRQTPRCQSDRRLSHVTVLLSGCQRVERAHTAAALSAFRHYIERRSVLLLRSTSKGKKRGVSPYGHRHRVFYHWPQPKTLPVRAQQQTSLTQAHGPEFPDVGKVCTCCYSFSNGKVPAAQFELSLRKSARCES